MTARFDCPKGSCQRHRRCMYLNHPECGLLHGIAPEIQAIVLFYKPPCGKWYVHSHKTYPTVDAAYDAAKKFLHPDTPIALLPVDVDYLETVHKIRIGELS